MIERYLVRYFLAVVDHGNFSRAAAQCNVSQPTLSVGIAKLERALERPLFERSNQRVQLTEAGSLFLAHARRIEREFNAALSAIADTEHKQSLRVGVLTSVPGAAVSAACHAARDIMPGPVEIVFAGERELLGMLERDRLDVALTIMRPTDHHFTQRMILDEGYMLVVAPGHPLADRAAIDAADLRDEAMIVRRHCEMLSQTSRFFVARGIRPHFSLRTTNDERALQMVAAGMGVTVMPESYRCAQVRHVPLQAFDHRRTLGFYMADPQHRIHPLVQSIEDVLGNGALLPV